MADYEVTDRNRIKREAERARYDEETVHAVLDEGLVAHVGLAVDGQPYVLPMAYARVGEKLVLHGSVASRLARGLAAGAPVCVTVTLLDGLVLARSAFFHSMNYRSVVVLGTARRLTDPAERAAAFDALVEHIAPGRSTEVRAPDPAEDRQTLLLEVDLREVSAKVRVGPPQDDPRDLAGADPGWGGVLPIATTFGAPEPDADTPDGTPIPASIARYGRPPAH